MSLQIIIDFAYLYITVSDLYEAREMKADLLAVSEHEMVPPKWEPNETLEEYEKKPMGHTDEPMVQKIYLLNRDLLPLITEQLKILGWHPSMEEHGCPLFFPGEEKTHDGLIKRLAKIGEVHDLHMNKVVSAVA
jgi:hypothetical protein